MPERNPQAPAPGKEIPSHYRWCYGCGVDHPTGLHLRVIAEEGLKVRGTFHVTEHHQGAPGLAHGGVLAAAMDEMVGALNWLLATPAVTGRLECDYRAPVPVGSELYMEAEVVGVKGRKIFTTALARLGGPDGATAVTAQALFVQVPLEHFLKHGSADQVQQAMADRANGGPSWRPEDPSNTGAGFEVNP